MEKHKLALRKVALRGFDDADREVAARALRGAGYEIQNTLTAAETVVVGPKGWDPAGALSPDAATSVVKWSELRLRLQPGADAGGHAMERRPVIERTPEGLRILGIDLPLQPDVRGMAPPADRFTRICLDRPFLETARAVALGVAHDLPTALEGATAASKTTVVLWLACQLNHPVVRLNLNGQTDTSELVGRYVPSARGDEGWDLPGLARMEGLLKPETLLLVKRALAQGRPLDWAESSVIAATEGLPRQRWRFQEGVVPQAMRAGSWVLLDEINLAEPQVLERLNPVLERPPGILLSEGDGTWIGPGGVHVHAGFRIMAALNPGDYAGRSPMSPAFRDRFLNWYQAAVPGEAEYLAQLEFLVHGRHPEVVIDGVLYQGEATAPVHACLASIPGIDDLLATMASCQASLASATGRGRKESPVFTRRGLNALMDLWAARRMARPAADPHALLAASLRDLYWNRIADAGERRAAIGAAEAAGLPLGKEARA